MLCYGYKIYDWTVSEKFQLLHYIIRLKTHKYFQKLVSAFIFQLFPKYFNEK